MQKRRSLFSVENAVLFAVFVLTVLFGYFCVWTHDDFLTRTDSLSDSIRESLYFGNGRYLGNFLVNVFLPYKLPDAFFRGVSMTALVALTAKLGAGYHWKSLLVSFALFAGLGNLIYSEAVIWGHGFYNFFPPAVLLLACVSVLQDIYAERSRGCKTGRLVLLAVFGFCQQLFSENTTCIALLAALTIFVAVCRLKRQKLFAAVYLASSALGAFVMFALPVIMGVSHKQDAYRGRGIGADTLPAFVSMFSKNLLVSLTSLAPMFIACALLSFAMLRRLRAGSGRRGAVRRLKPLLYPVFALQPFVSLGYFLVNGVKLKDRIPFTSVRVPELSSKIDVAAAAFFALYAVCVLFFLLADDAQKGRRTPCLCLFGFSLLSVGELLIITVMGPRCLFITACGISLFVLRYLSGTGALNKPLSLCAGAAGAACFLAVLFIMHGIWQVNNVRFSYARAQLAEGKQVIQIVRLPHGRWLHVPDESAGYGYYFNYGKTKPIEDYTFITYEDYLRSH